MPVRFLSTFLGPKYASLSADSKRTSDSDDSEDQPNLNYSSRKAPFWTLRNQLQLALALTCGILIGASAPRVTSGIVHIYHSHNHHHETPVTALRQQQGGEGKDCGSNPQEAKERGCIYDMMASTWDSPDCHQQELLDEILEEVEWIWYTDSNHTEVVSQDVAYSGNFVKMYPLYDFHIAHCVYLWRKLHQAVIKRLPIDEELYNYEHTKHCTQLIMGWHEPRKTVTRTVPGFPICRKFDFYEPVNGIPPVVATAMHH